MPDISLHSPNDSFNSLCLTPQAYPSFPLTHTNILKIYAFMPACAQTGRVRVGRPNCQHPSLVAFSTLKSPHSSASNLCSQGLGKVVFSGEWRLLLSCCTLPPACSHDYFQLLPEHLAFQPQHEKRLFLQGEGTV